MPRRRRKRGLNGFFILILAIVGYFVTIIISQQYYLTQVGRDQLLADERLAVATAENERLKAEMEQLNQLPYIEKLAREELGMTAAGELPYAPKRTEKEKHNN